MNDLDNFLLYCNERTDDEEQREEKRLKTHNERGQLTFPSTFYTPLSSPIHSIFKEEKMLAWPSLAAF